MNGFCEQHRYAKKPQLSSKNSVDKTSPENIRRNPEIWNKPCWLAENWMTIIEQNDPFEPSFEWNTRKCRVNVLVVSNKT